MGEGNASLDDIPIIEEWVVSQFELELHDRSLDVELALVSLLWGSID